MIYVVIGSGVRKLEILGKTTFVWLYRHGRVSSVAGHPSLALVEVEIPLEVVLDEALRTVVLIVGFRLPFAPGVVHVLIFYDHGHVGEGEVGGRCAVLHVSLVYEAVHLQAQFVVMSRLPQPVASHQVTMVEGVSVLVQVGRILRRHGEKARLRVRSSFEQCCQVEHLIAELLACVVVLVHHQRLAFLVESHAHQSVVVEDVLTIAQSDVGRACPDGLGVVL